MTGWAKVKYHVLIVSLIIWILGSSFWEYTSIAIYHFGIAQMVLVSSIVIYNQPNKTPYQSFVSRVVLYVSANNLADELFFNPCVIELNEYLSFFTFVIHTTWKVYKKY